MGTWVEIGPPTLSKPFLEDSLPPKLITLAHFQISRPKSGGAGPFSGKGTQTAAGVKRNYVAALRAILFTGLRRAASKATETSLRR